jgi:hypothetical protein
VSRREVALADVGRWAEGDPLLTKVCAHTLIAEALRN